MSEHKNKKKVCGGKRTAIQREVDTNFCIDLYVRGYAIREIHNRLLANLRERGMDYEVTFQQVFNDIKSEMIDWKKENVEMIDKYVDLELRKLDKLEVELWDSWERSKNGKRKTEIEGGTLNEGNVRGGVLRKRTLETGDGDPRYLDLILKIQERRAKLLGYNAPIRLDIYNKPKDEETPGANYDISSLPPDVLVQIAYQLQDAEFNKRKEEDGNGLTQ